MKDFRSKQNRQKINESCVQLKKKNTITNRPHAHKGYASTYNVVFLNSINPELQLKNVVNVQLEIN